MPARRPNKTRTHRTPAGRPVHIPVLKKSQRHSSRPFTSMVNEGGTPALAVSFGRGPPVARVASLPASPAAVAAVPSPPVTRGDSGATLTLSPKAFIRAISRLFGSDEGPPGRGHNPAGGIRTPQSESSPHSHHGPRPRTPKKCNRPQTPCQRLGKPHGCAAQLLRTCTRERVGLDFF